jgi:hypothetical protein
MAYRMIPLLGAYREQVLLGALSPGATATFRPGFGIPSGAPLPGRTALSLPFGTSISLPIPATQTAPGPAPRGPVSSPTVISMPAAPAPPVIQPLQPDVFTSTPNVLPVAPSIPTLPGSSPIAPTPGGGGGGGGGAPSAAISTEPAVAAVAPQAGAGWVLPALAAAGLLLFMTMRRGRAA